MFFLREFCRGEFFKIGGELRPPQWAYCSLLKKPETPDIFYTFYGFFKKKRLKKVHFLVRNQMKTLKNVQNAKFFCLFAEKLDI